MPNQPENLNFAIVTENMLSLANMFRDDGKYLIARALYRRAIAFLESIEPSEARHALLAATLDHQACLDRKMTCGHPLR